MESLQAVTIIDAYLDAMAKRDYGRARSYLANEGFEYLSPINHFSSADKFMAYIELATPIVHRFDLRKTFRDGDEFCHILSVTSQISEKRTATVVQWSLISEGKIQRLELIFDAYEYKILLQ
ncbi:MAG: nuclear transport factor 2 family protein [Pseudomonadota bacterium]